MSSILGDVLVQSFGSRLGEINAQSMDYQIKTLTEEKVVAISQEYANFTPNIQRIFQEAFKGSRFWSVLEEKFSQDDDDEMTRDS